MVAIEVVMVNNHVCRLDRRVFVYFLSCTYMSSHLSRLFFISAIFMLLSQAGVITVVEVVVTEVAAVEIMEAVVETMEAVTDIHRFEFCRYFALKLCLIFRILYLHSPTSNMMAGVINILIPTANNNKDMEVIGRVCLLWYMSVNQYLLIMMNFLLEFSIDKKCRLILYDASRNCLKTLFFYSKSLYLPISQNRMFSNHKICRFVLFYCRSTRRRGYGSLLCIICPGNATTRYFVNYKVGYLCILIVVFGFLVLFKHCF